MRWRTSARGCILASVILVSGSAAAQESAGFSRENQAVIGVENLVGVIHQRAKVGDGSFESNTIIGTPATITFGNLPAIPRLGLHYFILPPVSLGVGLHYSDNSIYGENLVFAPRLGVAVPFSDSSALWLRGGVTYAKTEILFFEADQWLPGGEVMLVLTPVEHFSFTVGGIVEIGVAGESSQVSFSFGPGATPSTSEDLRAQSFGLTLGVQLEF